jgi:hypothetical protein
MEGLMLSFADRHANAPAKSSGRRLLMGGLVAASALAGILLAAPAKADDDHGRGREHWHHHHDRDWRGPRVFVAPGYPGYYAPPPVYYAPPPAYYAPPPVYYAPSPGLNIVVPLHFH